MRTLPLVLLAALALCGCQSRDAAWQKAYNEKRATALRNGWEPARRPVYLAPKPQFARDQPQMTAGGPPVIMPPPIIINSEPMTPPRPSSPMPIIFTGGGNGTTIATQSEYATVVSQFGGPNSGTTIATQSDYGTVVSSFGGPLNLPSPPPPIDTRGRPIYYTEAIQQ